MSRKSLVIALSKLAPFNCVDASLEQYPTPVDLAADVLWVAHMRGDVMGKKVADLGCGNGILGVGAQLLGASDVVFLDRDEHALTVAKENAVDGNFLCCDITAFDETVDVVLMNPPFGVQKIHADKIFLEAAFAAASVIYSLHKITSKKFIAALAAQHGFVVEDVIPLDFVLPKTYEFHTQKKYVVKVGLWILRKSNL